MTKYNRLQVWNLALAYETDSVIWIGSGKFLAEIEQIFLFITVDETASLLVLGIAMLISKMKMGLGKEIETFWHKFQLCNESEKLFSFPPLHLLSEVSMEDSIA